MIRRALFITVLLSSTIIAGGTFAATKAAKEVDIEDATDGRMKVLAYDESDIYTIPTKYGFQTSIVFGQDEEIQTISVGDRSPWQLIPAGSRLFIRPMVEDVATNMTILTNRHSYQFDLKSLPAGKTSGLIYVARFIYPDDKPKSRPAPEPVAAPAPPPVYVAPAPAPMAVPAPAPVPTPMMPMEAPQPYHPPIHSGPTTPQNPNYSYTFSGPDDLAPLQAFDDGTSTFVKYRDINQPVPNTYIVDSHGKETPVTHSIRDGFMVIDAVAGEMALKNSSGTVHLYNETINPQ